MIKELIDNEIFQDFCKELLKFTLKKINKNLKRKIKDKIDELEKQENKEVIVQYLENKMFLAAKELRFEDAAYLRDKIKDIKKDYAV